MSEDALARRRPSWPGKENESTTDTKKENQMTAIDPIPTSTHAEAARDLLQRIRTMRGQTITRLLSDPKDRARVNGISGLPDELLEDVAYALESDVRLAAASEVPPQPLRDTVAFSRSYRPLLEELRLITKELAYEIAVRRAEAAKQVLKVYRLAKGLVRPEDKALLVPHLESMKRHFAARSKSRKASGEVPQTAPAQSENPKKT
jgi:hypothetical protein